MADCSSLIQPILRIYIPGKWLLIAFIARRGEEVSVSSFFQRPGNKSWVAPVVLDECNRA